MVAVFIMTGMVVPLIITVIAMNGGADRTTFLIALPSCIGMSMSIFANWESRDKGKIRWKFIILAACIDMFASIMNLNGLIFAGSALYTMVSSSMTVYIAVFSYFIFGRRLHVGQVFGIAVLILGLSTAAIGAQSDGKDVLLGVLMVFIGSATHAVGYIISEYLLVCAKDPISPEMLCCLLGSAGGGINLAWQIVYTAPRYQALVVDEIAENNGSGSVVLIGYILLALLSLVHSLCFFNLIGIIGSTSSTLR